MNGHKVSELIRVEFPGLLKEYTKKSIDVGSLTSSVLQMEEIIEESEINCLYSGSTFCGVFLDYEKMVIYCINCGDSRAVLYSEGGNKRKRWTNLSKDHKPDDSQEYLRIVSKGGRVERPKSFS